MQWDVGLYQSKHAFVFEHGASLVEFLAPRGDEAIIDLGCGTGQLTAQIARTGANVVGIDQSESMIAQARANFPEVTFEVGDAASFTVPYPVDVIFSNAALHWMKPPEKVARRMRAALKAGGRLVAEFGGKGNIATVLKAAHDASAQSGLGKSNLLDINYFPSIAQYASLLERRGFDVRLAMLFDRPTPLQGANGLRDWLAMFRQDFVASIEPSAREPFFLAFEAAAREKLFRDNIWFADYRRLRITAVAV